MKRLDVPAVQAVTTYIKDKYGIEGDLPFSDDFDDLAFRHQDNKKWFGLLILVDRQRFFPDEKAGEMYLLNLKSDPKKIMRRFINVLSISIGEDTSLFPIINLNMTKDISTFIRLKVSKSKNIKIETFSIFIYNASV